MKKKLLFSVFIYVLSFATASWSKESSVLENFYLISEESAQGSENVSFGYRPLSNEGFLQKARFETNMSYDAQDSGRNKSQTKIMSSFIYDIGSSSSFKPYIGIGAGILHMETDNSATFNSSNDLSETVEAYQVMTGFSYEPESHPSVAIHLGYSYSDSLNSAAIRNNLTYGQDNDPTGHSVAAFVSFKF